MIAPLDSQGISLPRVGLGTFRMQGAPARMPSRPTPSLARSFPCMRRLVSARQHAFEWYETLTRDMTGVAMASALIE
jgi:hypothetical protein